VADRARRLAEPPAARSRAGGPNRGDALGLSFARLRGRRARGALLPAGSELLVQGEAGGERWRQAERLLGELREILFREREHRVALVGAGRLGQAIASSPIFAEHGVTIAAIFDIDPAKVGTRLGEVTVSDCSHLRGSSVTRRSSPAYWPSQRQARNRSRATSSRRA